MRQKWPQKPPLGTPINFSHHSAKGLVLDLEFQENGGDRAYDLSGNANHGTLKNMAFPATTASGWNPGKFGPALKFDGTNDFVDWGDNDTLLGDNYTYAFWAKNNDSGPSIIIGKGSTGTGFYIFVEYSTTLDVTINSVELNIPNTSGWFTHGEWVHTVIVLDSGTLKAYKNGSYITSDTYTTPVANNYNFHIGAAQGGNWPWEGTIDQVRIYNRVLPGAEILDRYFDPFGMFKRTKWGLLVPTAPPTGAIINQFQKGNIGADLYDGVLIA